MFFLQLQATVVTDAQTEVLTAALMICHTNTGDVCVFLMVCVSCRSHTQMMEERASHHLTVRYDHMNPVRNSAGALPALHHHKLYL